MGSMDLSEAADARKKERVDAGPPADTKGTGSVLTVHDEAALRLGGRGGRLVGVRYRVGVRNRVVHKFGVQGLGNERLIASAAHKRRQSARSRLA